MGESLRGFVNKEELTRFERLKSEEKQLRSRAEVSGTPEEGQEIVIFDDKRKVVLNEYLPKGIRFVGTAGTRFESYVGQIGHSPHEELKSSPRVEFPPEELNTLDGRLQLLHEMGHSIYERSPKLKHKRYQRDLIGIADEIIDSIRKSDAYRTTSADQRKGYYLTEFKNEWEQKNKESVQPWGPLQYDDLAAAIHDLAKTERDSWAEALRLYRRIKAETNVDILDGIDEEEIFRHIKAVSLDSYDRVYRPLLELTGEDENVPSQDWVDKLLNWLERLAPS